MSNNLNFILTYRYVKIIQHDTNNSQQKKVIKKCKTKRRERMRSDRVLVCVRACVCACVRACVRACVLVSM